MDYECVLVETLVLSLSIRMTMACFALDYCKVNAARHQVTLTENLQRNESWLSVYVDFLK